MADCPRCKIKLNSEQGVEGYLRCPRCRLYWRQELGGRVSIIPFHQPPVSVKAQLAADGWVDVTPAERKWINDTLSQLTHSPEHLKKIEAKFKEWYKSQGDFWDLIHTLRVESGSHQDDIIKAMFEAYQINPQYQSEMAAAGAILPFVPEKQHAVAKKHISG